MRQRLPLWVIATSPRLRETVRAVLEGEYAVRVVSPAECPHRLAEKRIHAAAIVAERGLLTGTPPVPVLELSEAELTTAGDLRARIAALLKTEPESTPSNDLRARIHYPYLTRDAAAVAARAAASSLPVLITGPAGADPHAVALVIHALSARKDFLSHTSESLVASWSTIEGPSRTVFLRAAEKMDRRTAVLIEESVSRQALGDDSAPRWILHSALSSEDLLQRGLVPAELLHRVAILPIQLTPLRDRPHDVPALAEAILRARSAGIRPVVPSLTAAAVERLSNYLWFADIIELESVLVRTMALRGADPIDADDLLFGLECPEERTFVAAEIRPLAPHSRALSGETLELIVNELAHEFKNPLATIKAFAQLMPRSDEDAAQAARLTGVAIERMDAALDNLLRFVRFSAPCRRVVLLDQMVAPALLSAQVPDAAITTGELPPVPVFVDAEQLEYALDNVFHVFTHDIARPRLQITFAPPATVIITAESAPRASEHLSALGDSNAGTALPIRLAIAREVIARNGGRMEFDRSGAPIRIIIDLPVAEQEESLSGNGTTARFDR